MRGRSTTLRPKNIECSRTATAGAVRRQPSWHRKWWRFVSPQSLNEVDVSAVWRTVTAWEFRTYKARNT